MHVAGLSTGNVEKKNRTGSYLINPWSSEVNQEGIFLQYHEKHKKKGGGGET